MIEVIIDNPSGFPSYIALLASYAAYVSSYSDGKQRIQQYDSRWREYSVSQRPNNYDYRGVSFINQELSQVIIAHRGTEPDRFYTWTGANRELTKSGTVPNAHYCAYEYSVSVRRGVERDYRTQYSFLETGHSLGGMFAALNSYIFDSYAIAFDSPSIGYVFSNDHNFLNRLYSLPDNKERNSNLFTNYVTSPDIVNTSGSDWYGRWIRLYVPLMEITNTVQLAAATAKNIFSFFFSSSQDLGPFGRVATSYELNCHSLDAIIGAFSADFGIPYLQASVLEWPQGTIRHLFSYMKDAAPLKCLVQWYSNDVVAYNRRIEAALSNYGGFRLGAMIIPRFYCSTVPNDEETEKLNRYASTCIEKLEYFHDPYPFSDFSNRFRNQILLNTGINLYTRSLEPSSVPFVIGGETPAVSP